MFRIVLLSLLLIGPVAANVDIDTAAFGESLGGWKKGGKIVDYDLSGSEYRTYQPEITPTPDGGIFVSLRIDHRRGWLASNDHAVLEVSFAPNGSVSSAQSTLALQGRTISSDLIKGSAQAGQATSVVEGALKVGTDLVADLSAKLLREKVVEAGRVSYPAVLRHNYNLLIRSIVVRAEPIGAAGPPEETETNPESAEAIDPEETAEPPVPLDIRDYRRE